MIPKHKCIKHPLYCNEETGVHCWPVRWGPGEPSDDMIMSEKEKEYVTLKWQKESDANLRVIEKSLFSYEDGTPIELLDDAAKPYRILVWAKELP